MVKKAGDSEDRPSNISGKEGGGHSKQLERLQEKDPEFYEFLKEHDKELLEFSDDEIDNESQADLVSEDMQDTEEDDDVQPDITAEKKEEKPPQRTITMEMVESWCRSIREDRKVSAVRSLLSAFRRACHYGDDKDDDPSAKLLAMSSNVFNRVMLFALIEMDGVLRSLLKLPPFGGKKETIMGLRSTKLWKKYNHLVKSYLGNSLHVLNEMTDPQMIGFTLRRLRYSSFFLAAFPSLQRRYIKVALHFWGTGGGTLPVVALLFLRDLCIRLGSDCLEECFKGIYKAYVMNCRFINPMKLQHLHFLRNCVVELYRVDIPMAYQHAFGFIRQLAMILREALNTKTKESFRKVYEWKFINCLELWSAAVCAFSTEAEFRPLAYPLTQIISGVAQLVPTARYLPLRLRCVRMLNRIAAATDTFIPVSLLLLDMLVMKELNRPPTGGVGNAVDLHASLKVSKPTLKTRSFQEACVFSVVEDLAEHLAQWSYSVAFFELSFVPAVRLRSFCKSTKVERFRREMKELIHQIEANSKFTNEKRASASFLPNDPAAESFFLEYERKAGSSPMSKYVATLRTRAQNRNDSLMESSVVVGAESAAFEKNIAESDEEDDAPDEEGVAVFSSSWLPGKDRSKQSKTETEEKKKRRKRKPKTEEPGALDEDIVEDLVLSSDEESDMENDSPPMKKGGKGQELAKNQQRKSVKRDVSGKSRPITSKGKKRKRGRKASS
ncbi:Nucleolar complex-associated protein 2-like protein [Drosera capensis]